MSSLFSFDKMKQSSDVGLIKREADLADYYRGTNLGRVREAECEKYKAQLQADILAEKLKENKRGW